MASFDAVKVEQAFTVVAGEAVDVAVPLNAGVLFIDAPGASWIEVFTAKKDIQGNRTSLSGVYDVTFESHAAGGRLSYRRAAARQLDQGSRCIGHGRRAHRDKGRIVPTPLIEICVEGIDGLAAAQAAGAERVELCASLLEGGLTPSLGVIKQALAIATIPFHVIIRPRGGDFLYSELEHQTMLDDVRACREGGRRRRGCSAA